MGVMFSFCYWILTSFIAKLKTEKCFDKHYFIYILSSSKILITSPYLSRLYNVHQMFDMIIGIVHEYIQFQELDPSFSRGSFIVLRITKFSYFLFVKENVMYNNQVHSFQIIPGRLTLYK